MSFLITVSSRLTKNIIKGLLHTAIFDCKISILNSNKSGFHFVHGTCIKAVIKASFQFCVNPSV